MRVLGRRVIAASQGFNLGKGREKKWIYPLLVIVVFAVIGVIIYYSQNGNQFILDSDEDGIPDEVEKEIGSNPNKPNPNLAYALKNGLNKSYANLILPLDEDGKQQIEDKNFTDLVINFQSLLIIPTLRKYLENKTLDGKISLEELSYSKNFASLVDKLYNVILNEELAKSKVNITDYASMLGLKLGFDKIKANNSTAFAIGEYAIAVKELKLPLELEALKLLTKGTQMPKYGKDFVDFKTIVFYSVDGKHVYLSPNKPREVWTVATMLKKIKDDLGMDLTEKPETFFGFSQRIHACNWSLYDANYGISYHEKKNGRVIRPSDEDVKELIKLQFELDWKAKDGKYYNKDFPWWNSTELRKLYPEDNTLRQALLFKFYLPSATWDMEKGEKVVGLEGARISLEQSWREFKKISELYPNGKVEWPVHGVIPGDKVDPRFVYYGWIVDRGANNPDGSHRLPNTVEQFVGINFQTLHDIIWDHPNNFWDYIKSYNGLDQYLTKNWPYWDLVKFIAGYERWNPKVNEIEGINHIIPETLRTFGYPNNHIIIDPAPLGAGGSEWAVSLPQYVVNGLLENFPNAKILIGPGNTLGLYSCGDGLIKDKVKDVWEWIDLNKVYLMKTS